MGTIILTWNIQWGRGADGRVDLSRMLAEACAMGPFDVLCLQEVTSGFGHLPGQPGEDQWQELAGALGQAFTLIDGIALERHEGAQIRRFGNAIATRLPVLHVARHALPCPADAGPTMPRMAIEAIVQAPFGPLRVVSTHLEYYWKRSASRRSTPCARFMWRAACARPIHPRWGRNPPMARFVRSRRHAPPSSAAISTASRIPSPSGSPPYRSHMRQQPCTTPGKPHTAPRRNRRHSACMTGPGGRSRPTPAISCWSANR